MIPWLNADTAFPHVSKALTQADGAAGLLAAGADLSPARLLEAYRQGIFPWFSEGQPILWWSTDPRMVLLTDHFKVSDSLKKILKKVNQSMVFNPSNARWEIRFDSAFEQVMRACAAPRKDGAGTWISPDIIAAYSALHRQGYAHSSEVWLDGQLVGGAYGISIGRMFYGESMFAHIPNASKIALAYLVFFLKSNGVSMIDCQQETAHLASLGAAPVSREAFMTHLQQSITQTQIDVWKPPTSLPFF